MLHAIAPHGRLSCGGRLRVSIRMSLGGSGNSSPSREYQQHHTNDDADQMLAHGQPFAIDLPAQAQVTAARSDLLMTTLRSLVTLHCACSMKR